MSSTISQVTDSSVERPAVSKRERFAVSAAELFYRHGVHGTTLADVAAAAGIPVGNVYYYFRTKDQLIEAAIDAHLDRLHKTTADLNSLPSAADRLKELVRTWIDDRETTARFGCPFGTLAAELDKRDDGLDRRAGAVLQTLIDWAAEQFSELGRTDPREAAVTFVADYQGMSMVANALRDPGIMCSQGQRVIDWIDGMSVEPAT